MKESNHPVPVRYHQLLHIGEKDRRGGIISFKHPPVIIDSPESMTYSKNLVINEHVDLRELPLVYHQARSFIILRPTALHYRIFVREQFLESELQIQEEFELGNFMQLADILYILDPNKPYHWQWRVIMRSLHEMGVQDQNRAFVFVFKKSDVVGEKVASIKKKIRHNMGEMPVIIRYNNVAKIALGIHHLHSPEVDDIPIEYNALMHAKNKTSVFST